jgi:hypothetical protein
VDTGRASALMARPRAFNAAGHTHRNVVCHYPQLWGLPKLVSKLTVGFLSSFKEGEHGSTV